MTDPAACVHDDTVPVDTRDPDTGDTTTVARLCVDCSAQLAAGWGCPDCDWQSWEDRRLCDPAPTVHHYLARPCKEHA